MIYLTVGAGTEQGTPEAPPCCRNGALPAVFGILGVFLGGYTGKTSFTIGIGLAALAAAYFLMPQCKVK